MKLVAFANQEPRDVCILSVSGAVSSAVIQSHNPFGLVKLEVYITFHVLVQAVVLASCSDLSSVYVCMQGLYVITHMSGTFSNTESNGTVTRTGNLTVSLAGPDFMVVGGFVGGMLVAGSQVQVTKPFIVELVNGTLQDTDFAFLIYIYIGHCWNL